ncbi:S8 family peptidase [Zooshikella ganghwensis]|uniref:S8 family peptidase n=1 Tax=Zooshikella ganghwensis TaxID=202772 RepID=UPI000406204C|nr:S8 family peptidase [Zooshikella ganghwensis]
MKLNQVKGVTLSALFLSICSANTFADNPTQLPQPEPMTNIKGVIIEEPVQLKQKTQKRRSKRSVPLRAPVVEANDWYNLSPEEDNIEGSSVNKVYNQLSLTNKYKPVIVAVIDSGVDIKHEDLQGKIWENSREIPNNGIDDDGNGYVDDIHGWNFIGGKDGRHVNYDTLEITREYAKYQALLASGAYIPAKKKAYYEELSKTFQDEVKETTETRDRYVNYQAQIKENKALLSTYNYNDFSKEGLSSINSDIEEVVVARDFLLKILDLFGKYEKVDSRAEYYANKLAYNYNTEFDPRTDIVKDDPNNFWETGYGNNDVTGPDSDHGTHVSGIIAADRHNDIGIKGIAENVKIMVLRAVPNGDERDKDIANAVRYAVDNGASIINMSFGKSYSPNKAKLDLAFEYASNAGVLLVHAAGNDSNNNDEKPRYPNRNFKSFPGYKISNWLDVGASSANKGEDLPASFTNFGKRTVDIFAPGVKILSTIPGNQYAKYSGTSMATPVVSGIAALTLSQYPYLDGYYLKYMLLNTGREYPGLEVKQPDTPETKVEFSELSKTGSVADAYTLLRNFKQDQ